MEGSTPRIMSKKQSGMTASQSSIANAISQVGLEPPGSVTPNITQREREERGRIMREKQIEERARKLEELKQQAIAAQKYREQKEFERRQRIDEMRSKDSERRNQVEERKRQLWEAEQEKRETILKKAQEREARFQAKRRNERSSIVFAFGSSTPRMLEPVSSTSFWGRRAASTINVGYSGAPLTRRMSERELNVDSNYKKQRATSAHALHRKPEDSDADKTDEGERQTVDHFAFTPFSPHVRKMKTDLTPTLPSPSRETGRPFCLRSAGSSSVPLSRPQSAISNASEDKHPNVIHRPRPSIKPRPNSIAVSGINLSIAVSKELKNIDGKSPEPKTPTSTSRSSSITRSTQKSTIKKTNPPTSKRDAPSVPTTPSETKKPLPGSKPPKSAQKTAKIAEDPPSDVSEEKEAAPEAEEVQPIKSFPEAEQQQQQQQQEQEKQEQEEKSEAEEPKTPKAESPAPAPVPAETENNKEELPECDMTSSFTSKRISSEEEAKAALTERRRIMREQQEREAQLAEEMRKLQLQKEEEEKRKREEEVRARREEYRRKEELRRQEEQRRQEEEERLLKEQQEREAEERRKEEEERLAMEKELERKALEEAERQRQEIAERLRKEEEEREERRKRVAMIMSRTRNKEKANNAPVISNKDEAEETEGRVSPSDNVESAKTISNIKDALDKSVCQPTSDIIMEDVMLVNTTSQETNGHNNKNE